jgi:hypothetical protein
VTFLLPEETDELCPIVEAIEDILPGGLTGLLTSGGGLSGLFSTQNLSTIPNFNKLMNNYKSFLNLPIPSECPILLG